MSNYDLEEDSLLKYQVLLSFIFILTLIISISLSFNSMSKYKNTFYGKEEEIIILRINRIVSLLVALGFLFINIYDNSLKKKYGFDVKFSNLQTMASFITLVSSLIVLYIAFSNSGNVKYENPEL